MEKIYLMIAVCVIIMASPVVSKIIKAPVVVVEIVKTVVVVSVE